MFKYAAAVFLGLVVIGAEAAETPKAKTAQKDILACKVKGKSYDGAEPCVDEKGEIWPGTVPSRFVF